MPKLQTQQHSVEETEVLEDEPSNPSPSKPTNAIFNQQNNFHLTQNIDIENLTKLSEKNTDLADRVMCIYENQQKHNINIDENILVIEKKEQELRIKEIPYKRKFAFRALNFAWSLSILSLCASYLFATLGYPILAGTAIAIPIGVAVANMLGFKSASQQSPKKEKEEETKE